MTTPAGVPNLPIGALTVETLASQLQDLSAEAMYARAGERVPTIFAASTGGDILNNLSPFGILTNIWAGINSLIANSDPGDIQGPEDLPPLLLDFIEGLPVIGQLVTLLEAMLGTYTGTDETLLGIQDLLAPIRLLVDTIGQEIADFLNWLVNTLFNGSTDPLTNIFTTLAGLLDDAGELTTWLNSLLTDTWETLLTTLQALFGSFDLETFLQPLFAFWSWAWNGVAGGFAGFGGTVETVLKPAFEFLNWLFGSLFAGSVDALKAIFTKFEELLDPAGTLNEWFGQIPLLGPLVSAITKLSPLDGVTMDLSTLATWASGVLTGKSDIPAGQLKGVLPAGILSSIPLSNINFDTPNLLSQGDFGNATTITAQDGWSWDSSQNHTGSGGCAKVVCNGTARRLYSNQVIKVVAGDKINLSSYVKTSSDFSGSSTCIELILVPFVGTDRYTIGGNAVNVYFNTRGAATDWALATGSSGSGTAPWTVPTGVTSVRVRLSVTSAATAGSVWFDDIDLHKTGLLSGDWMQGIVGTVAADFQSIVDKVIQAIKGTITGGTGNPLNGILTSLQSIFSTLFNIPQLPTSLVSNPLLEIAVPGLQASKITSGQFGTSYIATDAITTDKIATGAVTSTEIGSDAVGTYQIADDAVGTAQIATDAVTQNELALGSVGSPEIINGSVTGGANGELATNTVVSTNVSEIDATKVGSGTINIDRLPKDALGLVGSGAHYYRATGVASGNITAGIQKFSASFFATQQSKTSDIAYDSNINRYYVTNAGWYRVELAFAVDSSFFASNWNIAPLIFASTNIINGAYSNTPYRVGSDYIAIGGNRGARYVNNNWAVYLPAQGWVEPGYDTDATRTAFIAGSSAFTYFGITLLNRSYA